MTPSFYLSLPKDRKPHFSTECELPFEQKLSSPLFDAPRFARHFENALWEMWQRHQVHQEKPERL